MECYHDLPGRGEKCFYVFYEAIDCCIFYEAIDCSSQEAAVLVDMYASTVLKMLMLALMVLCVRHGGVGFHASTLIRQFSVTTIGHPVRQLLALLASLSAAGSGQLAWNSSLPNG